MGGGAGDPCRRRGAAHAAACLLGAGGPGDRVDGGRPRPARVRRRRPGRARAVADPGGPGRRAPGGLGAWTPGRHHLARRAPDGRARPAGSWPRAGPAHARRGAGPAGGHHVLARHRRRQCGEHPDVPPGRLPRAPRPRGPARRGRADPADFPALNALWQNHRSASRPNEDPPEDLLRQGGLRRSPATGG
ncbi:hypothetical protein NOCARDAX2BIS_340078 [Nocardioides sp. AX2bis]|nr:hypothetical protein NOCARDAX2BIS_340078 [Nocardioides sp. AX2bis]